MHTSLATSFPHTLTVNSRSSAEQATLPTHIAQHQGGHSTHTEAQEQLPHPEDFELQEIVRKEQRSSPRDSVAEDNPLLADDSSSEIDQPSDHPMPSRTRSSTRRERPGSISSSTSPQNGHTMQRSHVEYRGKAGSLDNATDNMISHESFSLDREPPRTPTSADSSNHSFWELPLQDRRNFLLLVLLYFLQGVPMGLATGSVPFLLKAHLSYGQIGVFSLASYPYSLKLLWSPIVDAVWSPRFGRRKSWILPIQMMSGFGMLWLGARATKMMEAAGADGGAGVWGFTGWWFFLVFMCATQDIAVDGESTHPG